MATSSLNGGKTSPRVLADLKYYNPDRLPSTGHNILAHAPYPYEENAIPPKTFLKGACKHDWTLKPNQCTTQPLNVSEPALSVVAVICSKCRAHLKLELDTRGEGNGVKPCPRADGPLHHFMFLSKRSRFWNPAESPSKTMSESLMFQCSIKACSARLNLHIAASKLQPFVHLLLDRRLIEERAKKAMTSDPARFEGHAIPPPLTVLSNLRAYLNNAQRGEGRRVRADNKKWMLSLGDPCAELLTYLGFSRSDEGWDSPAPDAKEVVPFSSDLKVLLDDVDRELEVLMEQQPENERRDMKIHFKYQPAKKDMERLFGCHDYQKTVASRTATQVQNEDEHPYYAGLGAVLDFSDDLIQFSYERQCTCDPINLPYYLECLQGIAEGRHSEDLRTRAVIEASTGKLSMKDMREAYRALGLDAQTTSLEDDYIIGVFQSRVSDAPAQEDEMRQALALIGHHRRSSKIEQFASNTISTYEQALAWLGASEEMDDSFIVNMHGVKVNENASNTELAKQCLVLIADHRNSSSLKRYIDTGELVETEMDVGQAYARLDVGDRTIDDDVIFSSYSVAIQDQPSQEADLKRALVAIAKDRKSSHLASLAGINTTSTENNLPEWPVGLENIGNTCYLNSLLQFYFTIRPLRNLVLNFNQYRVDLEHDEIDKKRVGSSQIKRHEVERAQQFVIRLQRLFLDMISSPKASIAPEIPLAKLTLLSSSTEENFRRQSSVQGERPSLSDIEVKTATTHGPHPAPISEEAASEHASVTVVGDEKQRESTPASTITLQGEVVNDATPEEEASSMAIDPQKILQSPIAEENKENIAPLVISNEVEPTIAPMSLDNRTNSYKKVEPLKSQGSVAESSTVPAAPTRSPPPVPPRNKKPAFDNNKLIQEELKFGAQQDVTEVISNVLFQLQCAINPDYIDDTGEQIDLIKKLFFGKQKITTTNKDGKARTKEEFFSDIKIQVNDGPRDIYAALDAAFDEQEVVVGTSKEPQYTSISLLPPILQLHVARAGYDKEGKQAFKAIHHLEFKETIYMDRYMDSDDPVLKAKRAECWAWKKELNVLEKRQAYLRHTELGINMPEALNHTVNYLNQVIKLSETSEHGVAVSKSLPLVVADTARKMVVALEELERNTKEITDKINAQFVDLTSLPYHLHSVIIHRGNITSGHYWIYIYDFARRMWRKYNDGYVTEVSNTKEIYETESGVRPATSSFLVYVQEGKEMDMTDAVLREISEANVNGQSGNGSPRITMLDGAERLSDLPAQQLTRWPTDLHDGDVEMKDAGLVREPAIANHRGVTCPACNSFIFHNFNTPNPPSSPPLTPTSPNATQYQQPQYPHSRSQTHSIPEFVLALVLFLVLVSYLDSTSASSIPPRGPIPETETSKPQPQPQSKIPHPHSVPVLAPASSLLASITHRKAAAATAKLPVPPSSTSSINLKSSRNHFDTEDNNDAASTRCPDREPIKLCLRGGFADWNNKHKAKTPSRLANVTNSADIEREASSRPSTPDSLVPPPSLTGEDEEESSEESPEGRLMTDDLGEDAGEVEVYEEDEEYELEEGETREEEEEELEEGEIKEEEISGLSLRKMSSRGWDGQYDNDNGEGSSRSAGAEEQRGRGLRRGGSRGWRGQNDNDNGEGSSRSAGAEAEHIENIHTRVGDIYAEDSAGYDGPSVARAMEAIGAASRSSSQVSQAGKGKARARSVTPTPRKRKVEARHSEVARLRRLLYSKRKELDEARETCLAMEENSRLRERQGENSTGGENRGDTTAEGSLERLGSSDPTHENRGEPGEGSGNREDAVGEQISAQEWAGGLAAIESARRTSPGNGHRPLKRAGLETNDSRPRTRKLDDTGKLDGIARQSRRIEARQRDEELIEGTVGGFLQRSRSLDSIHESGGGQEQERDNGEENGREQREEREAGNETDGDRNDHVEGEAGDNNEEEQSGNGEEEKEEEGNVEMGMATTETLRSGRPTVVDTAGRSTEEQAEDLSAKEEATQEANVQEKMEEPNVEE